MPRIVAGVEAAFRLDAVLLHAERVDAEDERAPPVVEGVEVDAHPVVVADVVALGHGGAHRARHRVVREDADVERVRGEPDEHLGPLARRPAVCRLVLREPAEARGLQPRRLVEAAVDDGLFLDTGDRERWCARALDNGPRGRNRAGGRGPAARDLARGRHRGGMGSSRCVDGSVPRDFTAGLQSTRSRVERSARRVRALLTRALRPFDELRAVSSRAPQASAS